MLINVIHPEETRVAIVHDGRLMELNIEISGKEQIKGNIYKGIVLRVEPGLQAGVRGEDEFLAVVSSPETRRDNIPSRPMRLYYPGEI